MPTSSGTPLGIFRLRHSHTSNMHICHPLTQQNDPKRFPSPLNIQPIQSNCTHPALSSVTGTTIPQNTPRFRKHRLKEHSLFLSGSVLFPPLWPLTPPTASPHPPICASLKHWPGVLAMRPGCQLPDNIALGCTVDRWGDTREESQSKGHTQPGHPCSGPGIIPTAHLLGTSQGA